MTLLIDAVITKPNFDDIPNKLKEIPQWVVWNSRKREKKDGGYYLSKEPVSINNDFGFKWDNEKNLCTFQEVQTAYNNGNFNGIGFVLFPRDKLVCIDIDDLENVNDLPPELHNLTLHSYVEKSPSGNGLHLWIEGEKPEWVGTKQNGIEFFGGQTKFITVTGDKFNNAAIMSNQKLIDMIAERYFEKPQNKRNVRLIGNGNTLSDSELLAKMFASKNGKIIRNLWDGNIEGHNNDDSSADMALANHLAYWTNGDFTRIHNLMWQSALARDKWTKHPTYLAMTIEKAVASTTNTASIVPTQTKEIQQETVTVEHVDPGNKKSWWIENANGTKSLKHKILAEEVLKDFFIVRYPTAHSDLYYYNKKKGVYEQDTSGRQINAIIRSKDDLSRSQVKEVHEYLADMSPVVNTIAQDYIAVENGLLNLSTFELEPFNPGVFLIKKIPTAYNPNAYNEFVQNTLNKVTENHEPSIRNIEEMFACVMYPEILVPKMFYLYGRTAHNGKSSVLNMIHETFDNKGGNISAVSPQRLATNNFAGSSMYGKLANIVDDQPDQIIQDSGLLKTIITGGRIEIERKGKDSETVKMSTVCITASNFYPNFRESGNQLNRRLHIIPFEHNFSNDPDCISDKETMEILKSQSAREYVLKLAVTALKRMLSAENIAQDNLTKNEKSIEAAQSFAEYSDPLADYFFEFDKDYFENHAGSRVLQDYENWCKDNRVAYPLGTRRFKEAVCNQYDMEWKTKKIKINGQWKPVKGFKAK